MDQVLCYLCPLCPSEFTSYSLQRTLETLNQHISRKHGREARVVSVQNLRRLMCVPTGLNGSYICAQTPIPDVSTNFRCRSLFEQRSLILEETMTENELKMTQSEMFSFYPAPKDHSFVKECIEMLQEGERLSRHSWVDFMRHQMALDEKGSASSRAWVPVHTFSTITHYASTMAAFAFFCQRVDPTEFPKTIEMCDLFFKALTEPKKLLKYQFIARRFMNFSYLSMGRGVRSKQPVFVSQEAVALLYAFKVAYLIFATKLPNVQASVEIAVSTAQRFLNQASDAETPFKSIKRIKNQAKSCIASWSTTPITWVQGPDLYASLTVETGKGKYAVSHGELAVVFSNLMLEISKAFSILEIPTLSEDLFFQLKDVSTQCPNEGLASLNCYLFQSPVQELLFQNILKRDRLPEFLTACTSLGLNLLCAIHLAGGPGARAAEECFFTIRNTASCMRHVRMLGSSMVVIPDYCKQRKMSYKQPTLVVKFLPQVLAVALARYIIFVKELEARVVAHVMKSAEYGQTTRTYFCTTFGQVHDPEKFSSLLSGKFGQQGLDLNLHDLRHVLEAFARKIPKTSTTPSTLLRTANHSVLSSSSYGRSNEHADFVDADISEEDQTMCEIWNFKVLNQAHTVKVKEPSLQPSPTTMARKKQKLIDEPKSCQDTLVPLTLFSSPPLLSVHQKQEPSIDTVVVLRPMQAQACEFISASTANVLLIMPTGSGKTRIIQQMMRDTHCDIVLSPYALLSKQLAKVLGGCSYPCSQSDQYIAANAKCVICALDIVQVNSPLITLVQCLQSIGRMGSVWIDEAHCLITRGEFRPKFAEVWSFAAQLAKFNIHPRFFALTATLRPSDVDDLCSRLGISNISVMRFSCIRKDTQLELRKFAGRDAAREALFAWARKNQDEYLVILCTSVADATGISLELDCPMSASTTSHQDNTLVARFRSRKCMVGTSRAGTGLDLPEISRVALYGQPFSSEHIVQAIGRIRGVGIAALFYFKEAHRSSDDEVCKHVASSMCGADLLDKLYNVLDGTDAKGLERSCNVGPQAASAATLSHGVAIINSASVQTRVLHLKQRLGILKATFETIMMTTCCKVCYILTGKRLLHEIKSCQRIFNICLHCFESHQSRSCPRLPKLGRLCFRCFLPLDPVCGISFHDGPSGNKCDQISCDMLKPLCMLLFAKRLPITNINIDGDFFVWLLQRSERIPNVLRVLEYAFSFNPALTE